MNTATQTETLALSAVAAAAVLSTAAIAGESVTVPEVAPYELHLIPFVAAARKLTHPRPLCRLKTDPGV